MNDHSSRMGSKPSLVARLVITAAEHDSDIAVGVAVARQALVGRVHTDAQPAHLGIVPAADDCGPTVTSHASGGVR